MKPYLPPLELRNISKIGECIYCGSTDNLSTEHVMPRGMRGTVTLPAGSCTACRKITHEFETTCMRDTLLQIRVKHGLHQHSRERPQSFPMIFIDKSDRETVRQVHLDDFPYSWIMQLYEYPGILLNKKPEETGFGLLHAQRGDPVAYQKLLALPGIKKVGAETGGINSWVFARWIAKIGYCYAVARLGLDKVRSSPLVDMIRNGTKFPNYLVGGLNELNPVSQRFTLEPPSNEVFRVRMLDVSTRSGDVYTAVSVRLLPMLQGATYIAVVGKKVQNGPLLDQDTLDYERIQFALPSG